MTSPLTTVDTANASWPAELLPTVPPLGQVRAGTPTVAAEPAGTKVDPGVMHDARHVSAVMPLAAYAYWRAYSAWGEVATAPADATVMQLPRESAVVQGVVNTVPAMAPHTPREEVSMAIAE